MDSVYAVVDSLEKIKEIGPKYIANFERGNINYQTDHIRNGDIYWDKVVETEVNGEREERFYYRCAALYANLLQGRHDFEEGPFEFHFWLLDKMKRNRLFW